MPETIEQYKARILGHTEDKDPVMVQRETPRLLAELIQGAEKSKLTRNPQPGKWSVAQILAHLAESEIVASWRYRQMLERSGSEIIPFDQERWAEMGDYAGRDPQASLELFRLLREANVRLFARLTPEQWERYGMHAERGKETVRHFARMMAGHDLNHVEQIRRIVAAATPEQK